MDLSLVAGAVQSRAAALPYGLLPISTIQPGARYLNDIGNAWGMKVEAVRLLEVFVLGALGLSVGLIRTRGRSVDTAVFFAAATMAFLAFRAQASESADIYLYVGFAEATPSAYHPSPVPFSGDLAIINQLWGLPLIPSAYGPLWLALSKALIANLPTLAAKVAALRGIGLADVAICAAALLVLKVPRALLALFIANPAVYQLYVAEAHNDLAGVAFVLCAALARPHSRIAALTLCAAAGAVKLPFALIGMLVFADEPTMQRRISFALLSATISISTCFVWAGPWFPWALRQVYELGPGMQDPAQLFFHAAFALAAVAAILGAVTRRQFLIAGPWIIPGIAPVPLPHYLAWSFPFVFLDTKPKWIFLASLPLIAFILDTAYAVTPLTLVLLGTFVLTALGLLLFMMQRRRVGRNAP